MLLLKLKVASAVVPEPSSVSFVVFWFCRVNMVAMEMGINNSTVGATSTDSSSPLGVLIR